MNKAKYFISGTLCIIMFILGIILINSEYKEYAIITFALNVILLFITINGIVNNTNPYKKYISEVNKILKTYDSVLVKSNNVPSLENKDIIMADSINDLINVELERRKPICYVDYNNTCSFILIDNDEAYVYILKYNENTISPVEYEIDICKHKKKERKGIDSKVLDTLDKTTIVMLPNNKSYKISPIREKN